ncbi:MAG: hypothetical protein ACREHG_09290, partial [Candidatus Saccharimonadales bacterium]
MVDPSGFDHAPRFVKSHSHNPQRRPIIVIVDEQAISEDGIVTTIPELIAALPSYRPTLFATVGAADFLGMLDTIYSATYPNWQWRVSTHERDICGPDGKRMAIKISQAVHYFGWKGGNYHWIIDPVVMYGHRLDTIWPGPESRTAKLLSWTTAIQDFCIDSGVNVRPTTGAISAQFLTHPQFYPHARRKVPAAINASVRERMPGNHYQLHADAKTEREFTAYYLDQRRAHHYHAQTSHYPDANHLHAYGCFTDLREPILPTPGENFNGLICCDLCHNSRGGQHFN